MGTLLMCGGMLYLYSCCSVKLSRIEHNDELKIAIKFNPFYPLEYLINTIPHRRDKEEKKVKIINQGLKVSKKKTINRGAL